MYDADGKYFVGTFDGKTFKKEQGLKKFHHGPKLEDYNHGGTFYASQTFSNVPERDGRRIMIGWFRTETPFMPFNQSMTFPAELKLRKMNGEYVLTPVPVKEIAKLHAESYQVENTFLNNSVFTSPLLGEQLHIIAVIDRGDAREFGLNINGHELKYNRIEAHLNGTFYSIDNTMKFEIIVDKVGMEIFVDDGALYYAVRHNSVDNEKKLDIFPNRGSILLKNLEVYKLNSIWNEN